MDSRIVMNYLLLAVLVAAWTILMLIAVFHFVQTNQFIWGGFILSQFLAGGLLGFGSIRVTDNFAVNKAAVLIPLFIILADALLTIKLVSTLDLFSDPTLHIRAFVGGLIATGLGFGIPIMLILSRKQASKALIADGPPADLSVTDVILEETGIRCPICDSFPEEEGHYIIRCYRCNAEFCSKHIDEYEDRCWRCRTPIPYIEQLKRAVKENLSS